MNPTEYNKAQEVLKKLVTENGKSIPNVSEDNLANIINSMDKTEVTKKLNSMGLGFISEKLKNTSNEELVKMLKNNPQLLNKLNNFLK